MEHRRGTQDGAVEPRVRYRVGDQVEEGVRWCRCGGGDYDETHALGERVTMRRLDFQFADARNAGRGRSARRRRTRRRRSQRR